MKSITYSRVQELVRKLPKRELSRAYHFLQELTDNKSVDTKSHSEFLRLPIQERRRILAKQAEQMKTHYEQKSNDRAEWQAGDFVDEY